jgi:hypothetical protein
MAQINIPGSAAWLTVATALNNMFAEVFGRTGWGDYSDGLYTEASPLALVANVATFLPNDKATTLETQKPTDIATFYDGARIIGRNGDGLAVTVNFKAKPTVTATDEVMVFVDITAGTGTPVKFANLFKNITSFKQGVGVERPISLTFSGYTAATWETNGGRIKIQANGACDVYDISYTITRTHKAR